MTDAATPKNDDDPFLSPELSFLLAECRRCPSMTRAQVLSALSKPDFDCNSLIDLAIRNRLSPIFANNLRNLHLTDEIFHPVFHDAYTYKIQSMKFVSVLSWIFHLFQENNIRAVSLKGPLLAQEIYGNISLRHSSDLDILVEPEKFKTAWKLLLKNGFQTAECVTTEKRLNYLMKNSVFHHTILEKNGIIVELHWKDSDLEPFSFDELYGRCVTRTLCHSNIMVPGKKDCLILLIRHGVHHGFSKLLWLLDLYELILQMDEPLLQQTCLSLCETGYLFSLITILLLFKRYDLLAVEIENSPATVIFRPFCDHIILQTPFADMPYSIALQLSNASAKITLSRGNPDRNVLWKKYTALYRKIRCQAGIVKSTPEFLRLVSPGPQEFRLINLPDSLFFLYYPIRILYWLFRFLLLSKKSGEDT